ncbi:STAS domain-containing protein [Sulfitobacter aestuariivivens]|uniref:Anti-sigma factor antagonist n=1 Tax=Sulfitobacter aestuariivivens TaxID=2766981 RepID=A0A927D629_9RHOB|nr:STAS domain-containing protein [Sulfitobacter aestuariivivens]MBD3665690.1 STAS domain-containing protein [Sulfitobacter aestuariivivens]
MEVLARTEADMQVVSVQDSRIDAAVALAFKDAMRNTTDGGPQTVVLDLQKVDFIDSSGLGAIVATMKHLAPDRKLVLAGLSPTVDKVFKLTRMDTVFRVFTSLDDALSDVRA